MSEHPPSLPKVSDAELEPLLVGYLDGPRLSSEALERVRAAVTLVWDQTHRSAQTATLRRLPRPWRRKSALAIAASLAAAVVIFLVTMPNHDRGVIGSLARTSDGGMVRQGGFFWHHALTVGDALRVGDTLNARGPALVLLAEGGTLRIAGDSVIEVEAPTQLSLNRGKLYVDKPMESATHHPLRVATRVGMVEHLGTEFEIASDVRYVRIRVREGEVRFSGATGALIAPAGTELLATSEGRITQQPIQTFGRDWQWTAALAPEFVVEGRSLNDYLQWISRELGRNLVFSDARARESAQRTVLHGTTHSAATLDSLADVLSSTSLTYELADGAIRVHSVR